MNAPDLGPSGGYVNPFMANFDASTVAAYHKWQNKTLEECVAEEGRLAKTLNQAAEQVTMTDGTMNFDGLTMWAGDTQEKSGKLIEIHSSFSGVRQAINEKRQAEFEKKQREEAERRSTIDANHGGGGQSPVQVTLPRRIMASQAIDDACQKQHDGKTLREALTGLRNGVVVIDREFDKNMPAHEFRATVFTTTEEAGSVGWDPFITREGGWTPRRTTPIQVTDIIPMFMTEKDGVSWMEETLQTNAAAERAENAAAPESAYGLTERSETVRRISHFLPVTEESLSDEPQVRGYLDYIMPLGVKQRLDGQIINGDGLAPNIGGILKNAKKAAAARTIPVKALSRTDGKIPKPWNVLLEANYQIRDHGMGVLGMQVPTHAVLNPNVYLECLLSESASGGYYAASPMSPLLDIAWGMQVVQTSHLVDTASGAVDAPAGWNYSGIIGDFSPMFIRMYMRHELRTEFGFIASDFQHFRVSVRSSVRGCLAIMREGAFVGLVNPIANGNAVVLSN